MLMEGFIPLIKAINTEIQKSISHELNRHPGNHLNITSQQLGVMGYLYAHGRHKKVFPSDLEKVFNLSRPTISGIIKRLREVGMVELVADQQDRRFRTVELTPGALDLMSRHMPEFDAGVRALEGQLTQGMTDTEVRTFKTLLRQALQNMKAERTNQIGKRTQAGG